jgi:hypothetical protein
LPGLLGRGPLMSCAGGLFERRAPWPAVHARFVATASELLRTNRNPGSPQASVLAAPHLERPECSRETGHSDRGGRREPRSTHLRDLADRDRHAGREICAAGGPHPTAPTGQALGVGPLGRAAAGPLLSSSCGGGPSSTPQQRLRPSAAVAPARVRAAAPDITTAGWRAIPVVMASLPAGRLRTSCRRSSRYGTGLVSHRDADML